MSQAEMMKKLAESLKNNANANAVVSGDGQSMSGMFHEVEKINEEQSNIKEELENKEK